MTDFINDQFGKALTNFKMKNIDTASLNEIIGEFAPLIGVGKEETLALQSHGNSKLIEETKPLLLNIKTEPEDGYNTKEISKDGELRIKVKTEPNDSFDDVLDLSIQPNSHIKTSTLESSSKSGTKKSAGLHNGANNFVKEAIVKKLSFNASLLKETQNDPNDQYIEVIIKSNTNTDDVPMDTSEGDNTHSSKTSKALYEIKSVYAMKYYQCRLCERVYNTKYHLNRHLMTHAGNRPHHCVKCTKSFAQKCDLNRHMHIHDSLRRHACSVCGKSFKRADYLTKHERQYCGVLKPHKCEKCSKGFGELEELAEHKRTHNESTFHCEHCSEEFDTVNMLVEHRKVHRSKQQEQFTCSRCNQVFTEFITYVEHFKIHSGDRPYRCDLCKKTFSRNHNLMTHMWIHNEEKQHTCHICAKTFTYFSNLQVHLRVHRNERPYICKQCDKGFLTSSDLRRHQRTHSGEKPYKCVTCHATFARKERLLNHMVTHIQEDMSGDSNVSNGSNDTIDEVLKDSSIPENVSVSQVIKQEYSGDSSVLNCINDDNGMSKDSTSSVFDKKGIKEEKIVKNDDSLDRKIKVEVDQMDIYVDVDETKH